MSTVLDSKPTESNQIERQILINAPRARVWQALTNAEQFGRWFGAKLEGQQFVVGQRTRGQITICGFENVWFDVMVERVEPQQFFSYRWHPYAIDPAVDYDKEEPTLVTFTLNDAANNSTLVSIVESGFDKVAPQRRLEAFRMNNRGWDQQLNNLARYASE